MKRLLSLAASAAMLAVPMSVAAQAPDPALDAFQKVCWGSGGDYLAAVKAAEADGWTDTAVTGGDDSTGSVTDKAAKAKFAGGASLTLLVSRGLQHTKTGDLKVENCKLVVSKADNALLAEGKSWLGGAAPNATPEAGLAIYIVKLAPGAPNHIAGDEASLNAALNTGGFAMLKFQQDSDAGILVYTAYSK